MRPHHKTHEWFVIATLLVIVIIGYLLYTTAQIAAKDITLQTALFTNMVNLMIFAALLVLIIIMLRVYGRLEELVKNTARGFR